MRVRMRYQRLYQDVYGERTLEAGQEYELPTVVAEAFVATTAAVVVADPTASPAPAAPASAGKGAAHKRASARAQA